MGLFSFIKSLFIDDMTSAPSHKTDSFDEPFSHGNTSFDDPIQSLRTNDDMSMFDDSHGVNPANGLPMINSSIDIMGNAFGTDSFSSLNHSSFDSFSHSSFDDSWSSSSSFSDSFSRWD